MDKKLHNMEEDLDEDMSSDDDSSDDETEALVARAEEIERELSTNVYLYDLHLELVGIFEKTADLISLRLAYERFHKTFPLTPAIWLKWIKIEQALVSCSEEKKFVINLYEKATQDYLSIKLWLEYAQFAMSNCELEETHQILERGLSAAGLHFSDASLLWDILRELELAHLSVTEKDSDAYKAQLQKVVEAFKRQLSVPLRNVEDTYQEWKDFIAQLPEGSVDASVVDYGYENALKSVEKYKPYEGRMEMVNSDEELWDVYKEYIKSVKDPSVILCLYERALEKLCLNHEVWMDYCTFAMKLGEAVVKITERAVRNVTWHEQLWCLRLQVLEKCQRDDSDVLQCFESGLASVQGGLELWLEFIGYTRRNKPERLEKLLQQVEDLNIPDPTYKLTKLHARYCAKNKKMEETRELWNSLMLEPVAKSSAQFWLEYARLERQYGSAQSTRAVFNRAITCNTDWPQAIADEWTLFEVEEGSLEDLLKTKEKIKKILPEKLKTVLETQSRQTQDTQNGDNEKKRKNLERGKTLEEQKAISRENQHKRFKAEPKKVVLPRNQGAPADLDPLKSVFVSNLSPVVSTEDLRRLFPKGKVTLATNNKGLSRCFGFVQFDSEDEAQKALERDREPHEGRPIFISKCKTDPVDRQAAFKFSQNAETNKLFVRGLPVKCSKEDVENLFRPYNFVEVRLVMHKSGQSKGLAYVEFANENDAQAALKATDKTNVDNFIISVAVSAPPTKNSRHEQQEPIRHARSRLQVPLVPRVLAPKASTSLDKPKSNNDFRNMLLNKS